MKWVREFAPGFGLRQRMTGRKAEASGYVETTRYAGLDTFRRRYAHGPSDAVEDLRRVVAGTILSFFVRAFDVTGRGHRCGTQFGHFLRHAPLRPAWEMSDNREISN